MMDILTGRLGPRELALAGAFGVLLGLVPKENLLFAALAVLFFFSHANLVAGLAVAVVVSFFAPWTYEHWADPLGNAVLTSPGGQTVVGALFRIPLLPWTMLDRTVVLGSFLTGAGLFFPLYFLLWVPLKIAWPKKQPEKDDIQGQTRLEPRP